MFQKKLLSMPFLQHALVAAGIALSLAVCATAPAAETKTMVYATDGEYLEPTDEIYLPYIEFFDKADLLIFDAMYSTLEKVIERENFGHSTPLIGIGLAMSAGVKKLVLFHHDPESNDSQIARAFFEAKEYLDTRGKAISDSPLELIVSYDGLVIEI